MGNNTVQSNLQVWWLVTRTKETNIYVGIQIFLKQFSL